LHNCCYISGLWFREDSWGYTCH